MPRAGSIDPASPAREVLAGIFGGAGKPTGAKVAVPLILTADLQGDADVHGIQNPYDSDCLVAAVVNVATADDTETIDVGVDDGGDASNDGLIDGLSVAAIGVFNSWDDPGTNGNAFALLHKKGGTNDYLVWKASAGTNRLAGEIVFVLIPLNK